MTQGEVSSGERTSSTTRARRRATDRGGRDGESRAWLIGMAAVLAPTIVGLAWLATSGLPWLALVIAVVLAGLTTWIAIPVRRARRRARQVQRWAARHGWFAESPDASTLLGGSEVLHGVVDGVPVTSCTTVYEPDWRRGLDTSRFRHLLMGRLPVRFPTLTMVPTGGPRRAPAGPDEGPAVQVEWSAFNDAWLVRCADAQFAHAFCHPRLMERLMQPDVRGLSVLVVDSDLAVHALGRTDLDSLEARAAVVRDLVELVPGFLVEEHWAPPWPRTQRPVPTAVLRGAMPGESTGWPTVIMTAISLAGVAWFVAGMVRVGAIDVALCTVGVIAVVGAIPLLRSRVVRRMRRDLW